MVSSASLGVVQLGGGLPPPPAAGPDGAMPGGFKGGRPPKADDPGPVRQGQTHAQRQATTKKRQAAAARDAKMDVAAAAAQRELTTAQVGVVRASLFDADDWRREHQARQQRMESTFTRLYKPQASNYWVTKQKAPPRRAPPGQLPVYTKTLPDALSLAHPSSREIPSSDDDDDDDDRDDADWAPPADDPSAFDPLAEPRRFYAEFKERVGALKVGIKDDPTDRPTQAALQPRNADALIAAANAPSPPPPPPPAPSLEAPSWSVSGARAPVNPILDEDFDVEPGLVYTDTAHYLADTHGVSIPMWDELDAELSSLDAAHKDAMNELASRREAPLPQPLPPQIAAAGGGAAASGVLPTSV